MERLINRLFAQYFVKTFQLGILEGQRQAHASDAMLVDLKNNIPGASFQEGSKEKCFAELYAHFRACAAARHKAYSELV